MPKTSTSYTTLSVEKALEEVRSGGKIREIARKYGIPKSTLHFKKKHPDHKTSLGPSPYLSFQEESCLEKWIVELSKKGFPLKREELQYSVQKFLTDHPRPHPFKDNFPGDGWVRGFLKRHPTIAERTSEGVTYSSACVSEADIRKWFAEIRQYFVERDLLKIFEDPRRVFNGDESGFQLCPKTGKVLSEKGLKNVYTVETSCSKDNMTVMFTFSASGRSCPPMVVYNYQRIPQKVVEGVPSDWGIGRSENGWMTSELFFEYVANVFHPYLIRENIPLPVIYFLDGHRTHLTYELSKLCTKLQIELIALYPNATRILQPADVAVFRPVKAAWKAATREWLSQNPEQVVTKANFAEVLNVAIQKSVKAQTLINGFKACGLVPFDPNAVDYTKCVSSSNKTNTDTDVITHAPNDTITYSQFVQLIGPTKEAELKNCGDRELMDENLKILHEIYKNFGKQNKQSITDKTSEPAENDIDRTPSPSIMEDNENLSNIALSQFDETCTGFTPEPLKQTTTEARPNTTIKILRDVLISKQPDSYSSYGLCPITGILVTAAPEKTPTKLFNTVTSYPVSNPLASEPLAHVSEDSPAFKVRTSDLGPYLTLPKTPERKGKREIKRMPFAITSAKYRAMYKEQMAKKESEVQKKEERKRLREEAKEKKETTKREKLEETTKVKKKLTSSNTNCCKVCAKATKTVNRLVCDMCSCIFHVKCVPHKHQIHVPLPEDISTDLFVCHSCYQEEENDEDVDDDKEIYGPKNSDDDSNMSLKENSEDTVNFLYTECIAAKRG